VVREHYRHVAGSLIFGKNSLAAKTGRVSGNDPTLIDAVQAIA
jgi:hypothetical protein